MMLARKLALAAAVSATGVIVAATPRAAYA